MIKSFFLPSLLFAIFFLEEGASQNIISQDIKIDSYPIGSQINFTSETQENIFIFFDNSAGSTYKSTQGNPFNLKEYHFSLPSNSNETHYINIGVTLIDRKYKDFDSQISKNPSPRLRIHKSFIRKNRKQIFTIKKMKKIGQEKMFSLLQKAKHIFLIDLSEKDGDFIILKEVQHSYIGEE